MSEEGLKLVVHGYETDTTREEFLSFETAEGRIAAFLRLSLPDLSKRSETLEIWTAIPELEGAGMIREVHVYGPALGIGHDSAGEAQHLGLGRRLIAEAKVRAHIAGLAKLAVISAIGTRRYYEQIGFERGELYMATATFLK